MKWITKELENIIIQYPDQFQVVESKPAPGKLTPFLIKAPYGDISFMEEVEQEPGLNSPEDVLNDTERLRKATGFTGQSLNITQITKDHYFLSGLTVRESTVSHRLYTVSNGKLCTRVFIHWKNEFQKEFLNYKQLDEIVEKISFK